MGESFEQQLRSIFPGQWIYLTDTTEDPKKELLTGTILAHETNPFDLQRAVSARGHDSYLRQSFVLVPFDLKDLSLACFGSSVRYRERKPLLLNFLKSVTDLAIQAQLVSAFIRNAPFFMQSRAGGFEYWVTKRFTRQCYTIDGFIRTLMLTGRDSSESAKGYMQELTRLYGMILHGVRPAAIGKMISIPGHGRTDIDVLTSDGLWCESKRYPGGLSLTTKLRKKMEKMSAALKIGMIVHLPHKSIVISKLILVNAGPITSGVKKLADELNIEVNENSVYAHLPY